jgi:hypothetical protein
MTTLRLSTALTRRALSTTAAALFLSAAGVPAMAGNLCISMSNSGGQVAGVQLDLKWDGGCMSADKAGGSKAKCVANTSTGKDVQTSVKAGPTLTALFFSMSDTNPIPDGDLFCCSFTPSSTAGSACCGLSMGRVSGSDSSGTAIPASGFDLLATMDGQACTASGGGGGSGGGRQLPPVRSGLQGGGVAPPVVSIPGGGAAAGAPQAPRAGLPAAPAGGGAEPEAPSGMDQVQRALEQLAPHLAPTAAAEATAGEVVSTPRTAAGTPTAKAHATQAHGTPTAAAKKTPSAAVTPGSKTPGATPKATPKAGD